MARQDRRRRRPRRAPDLSRGAAELGRNQSPESGEFVAILAGRARSEPHDHPDGEASHDLRLRRPRAARRASDDAAPSRQQRPAALERTPRHRAPSAPASLDPRRFRQLRRHRRLRRRDPEPPVENTITLEHIASDEPEFQLEDRARTYPFSYDAEELPDLARAIERHYPDPSGDLERWVRQFVNPGGPTETAALLMTLTNAIKEGLAYERRTDKGTQSPVYTLSSRRGSCRDFATLMMEAARALGFAARFVSGYLYVPSRDAEEGHRGGGSTHAWCQIFLPGRAGSSSTRPTASSAVATSSGSPSRETPDRPFRCTGPIGATPRTKREWSCPSMSGACRKCEAFQGRELSRPAPGFDRAPLIDPTGGLSHADRSGIYHRL